MASGRIEPRVTARTSNRKGLVARRKKPRRNVLAAIRRLNGMFAGQNLLSILKADREKERHA